MMIIHESQDWLIIFRSMSLVRIDLSLKIILWYWWSKFIVYSLIDSMTILQVDREIFRTEILLERYYHLMWIFLVMQALARKIESIE